jgi:hypothetical protein
VLGLARNGITNFGIDFLREALCDNSGSAIKEDNSGSALKEDKSGSALKELDLSNN